MHEAGIAQSIIDIVEETAIKNNADRVLKVFVEIGKLQAIETDSLLFAFEALKYDTIVSEAELIITEIPVTGICRDCNHKTVYDDYIFSCSKCSSVNVEIVAGEELKITEIEVNYEQS